jgi:hypothetical protein
MSLKPTSTLRQAQPADWPAVEALLLAMPDVAATGRTAQARWRNVTKALGILFKPC